MLDNVPEGQIDPRDVAEREIQEDPYPNKLKLR